MGKIIINECNPFFEMEGKEGDVLYSFTGNCGLTKNSVLCDKTINLNEMYDTMLGDVKVFLFGGEFVSLIENVKGKSGITQLVKTYTFKKYGITIENVYNKIHGNTTSTTMTVDTLFNELKNRYGMTGMDWMYLYDNVRQFRTDDVEILDYMCNKILSNKIYEYFVVEYSLRTVGVVKKVKQFIRNKVSVDTSINFIKIEWNNGSRDMHLSDFLKNHKQWWGYMTRKQDRCDIRDYDVLLNGKSVTEVFPVYCPVFSNLRMNYTGIDFDNGKNNIRKCSEIAGYSDKGETWSFASIDRIDSNKGYSYDNIRIISHYANHLKNVGNIEQMRRLVRYMDKQNSYF
jgi:hypothetical protein